MNNSTTLNFSPVGQLTGKQIYSASKNDRAIQHRYYNGAAHVPTGFRRSAQSANFVSGRINSGKSIFNDFLKAPAGRKYTKKEMKSNNYQTNATGLVPNYNQKMEKYKYGKPTSKYNLVGMRDPRMTGISNDDIHSYPAPPGSRNALINKSMGKYTTLMGAATHSPGNPNNTKYIRSSNGGLIMEVD